MYRSRSFSPLRWIGLLLIFAAIIITTVQLVSYSRVRTNLPSGLTIAHIPVGGLDRQRAAERLIQAYAVPVEIHYNEAIIQVKPSTIGFQLNLEAMLTAADLQRVNQPFWGGFWDFLWNRSQPVSPVPLRSSLSEDRLRAYLSGEIAPRYDQSPSAAAPVPGTAEYQPGKPGTTLDIERAITLIRDALESPTARIVNLSFSSIPPAGPVFQNVEVLLKQIIQVSGFSGIVELYLEDLQTYQVIHFAYDGAAQEALTPNIAFSAWSTIKIPVMVSAFGRMPEPAPADQVVLMERMIERSDNDSTDRLASTVIDKNLGPLQVTEDMQAIGLVNTFWAGYFYPGAPLLDRYDTPANLRTDINTGPDIYDQTTPAELGMLLEDIYLCAQNGGGTLAAAFPGLISQQECQQMITFLARNQIAVLIQAGVPASATVAHKHGWVTETDGYLHTMGDAGLVYTPGGNYVLVIFVHHPVQVLFEPVNQLFAEMSKAIFNFYNIPQ